MYRPDAYSILVTEACWLSSRTTCMQNMLRVPAMTTPRATESDAEFDSGSTIKVPDEVSLSTPEGEILKVHNTNQTLTITNPEKGMLVVVPSVTAVLEWNGTNWIYKPRRACQCLEILEPKSVLGTKPGYSGNAADTGEED